MKSSLFLVLAACVAYSVAADAEDVTINTVNWRYDNDTIPEMLPRTMLEKSNEEIGKAVCKAYKIQMKVISEYSGHVYDPLFPFGYFKKEYPIPNTHTYQTDTDLVFNNNVVKGLRDYDQNVIVIKWAPDQIETYVEWKEANIRGNYYYSNSTYFDQGNYLIELENLKYLANTTLSENTMRYPASVPKSSISYGKVKASFSGNIPVVTNVENSYNLKYFLEDVASQHIADSVAKSMQPNVTIAIRQGVRPYIMFKNVSDPHFKGFTYNTSSGIKFKVDNVFTNGLNQTHLRVTNMTADMANKKLISVTELVMHNLSGTFQMQLTNDSKQYSSYASFKIENIKVVPISNMFNRDDCSANTTVTNTKVTIGPEFNLSKTELNEIINILEQEFSSTLKNKFDKTVCIALADMLNSKAGNF